MAETAVNIAIQQLATLLIQEANRLSGAREGVASIQLEVIRAFLKDADQQQHTNEAIKVWVKQVREAAYSIEDALDLYFYRMKLQTLDMKLTPIASLPQGILKLKSLRHVLVYEKVHYGVDMPEKFGSLASLQKLANVNITGGDGQIEELSKLTQLRRLAIMKVSPDCGEALCAAIKNMSFLQSLYLYTGEDDEVLAIDKLSMKSPFLRSINLRGKLNALPEFILSLHCLEKLRLNCCKLQTDLFMSLQYLPCLVELYLHNKAYEGEELRTESGGFGRLKKLYVQNTPLLRRVVIAEGAMLNLDYLEFFKCARLERVPTGIENLKTLKELFLGFVPQECVKKVRKAGGEDWDRVKHIPLVKEVYEENGKLYRRDP